MLPEQRRIGRRIRKQRREQRERLARHAANFAALSAAMRNVTVSAATAAAALNLFHIGFIRAREAQEATMLGTDPVEAYIATTVTPADLQSLQDWHS